MDSTREIITSRIARFGSQYPHIKTLIDAEATRDAVIQAFRTQLGHAGPDDDVLFYFSGHGSQEAASEAHWVTEPDHLNETLVLFDSRSSSSRDLADRALCADRGDCRSRIESHSCTRLLPLRLGNASAAAHGKCGPSRTGRPSSAGNQRAIKESPDGATCRGSITVRLENQTSTRSARCLSR